MRGLDERLTDWIEHGLITEEQAAAIRQRERERQTGSGRIPIVAEAAGYVGGVLAVVGVGVLLEDFWERMTPGSFVVLAVLVSAILAVVGAVLRDHAEPAAQRLVSVVWLLSVGGVAMAAGIYGGEFTTAEDAGFVLVVGVPTTAYAATLWALRDQILQVVALFGSAITTYFGLLTLPDVELEALGVGLAVIVFGAGWTAAGRRELLRPSDVVMLLGTATVVVGSQIVGAGDHRGAGLVLACVVAGLLVAVGVADSRPLFLGAGAVAVFITVPQVVFHFFGDTIGAPVALLLTGVALLATALALIRLRREV